eukprot:gene2491-3243_t
MSVSLAMNIPFTVFYFAMYDVFKGLLYDLAPLASNNQGRVPQTRGTPDEGAPLYHLAPMFAGAASRTITVLAMNPFE